MSRLRDLAREIVSVSEGEIEKREATIVALRHEVGQLKKELSEARNQRLNIRSDKCEHCAYRIVATKVLESEEKAKRGVD